jgi:hypothetical protein
MRSKKYWKQGSEDNHFLLSTGDFPNSLLKALEK